MRRASVSISPLRSTAICVSKSPGTADCSRLCLSSRNRDCRASAFDIGIILNNLLDNAIEACEKLEQEQRYINLTLKKKNHFLLIEVENSFDGKVIWEDGGIVPMTTKQSDLPDILMEHGIGLKNVKDVADHYLGDMDIKIKNDVFKVTVMLQQKEIK